MNLRRRTFDRAYRSGRARWDTGITPPEVITYLGSGVPAGRALDLGCGTGTNAHYLAERGWQVVGVDFSLLAIRAAREKLSADPRVTFIHGDVTDLPGVEGTFDFVLDIGCFHGVPASKRDAYVRAVAAHTGAGATLLMFTFGPTLHIPGRHPTREAEIRRRFGSAFELTRIELGTRPAGAAWFTLRRM